MLNNDVNNLFNAEDDHESFFRFLELRIYPTFEAQNQKNGSIAKVLILNYVTLTMMWSLKMNVQTSNLFIFYFHLILIET